MRTPVRIRSRRLSVLTVMLVTLLVCSGLAYKAEAVNVILDYSFGTSGVVVGPTESVAGDMALQSDGKIVIAGRVSFPDSAFKLARYNTNGSLDSTFGSGGIVITVFPNEYQQAGATAIAIQPDGKILAGGYVRTGAAYSEYDFGLARYNTDGSLDTMFGNGGTVTADFNNNLDKIEDIALQPDGKIVCLGNAYYINNQQFNDLAMIRYNSNGIVDTGFGASGKVTSSSTYGEFMLAVAVQSDGKIVTGGQVLNAGTLLDFAVARYNSNGSIDTGFGNGGLVSIDHATNDETATDVALQPDGKIVAVGYKPSAMIVTRLNTDGTVDSGFTPPTAETLGAPTVVLQSDGKLVVGGNITDAQNQSDFALVRLNSSGTLDTSFNGDGRARAPLSPISNDQVVAIAIQSDGKIIAAGTSSGYVGGSSYAAFALARFQTTPRAPFKPYDFDGDGKADLGVFRPSNGGWYVRLSSSGALSGVKWGTAGDLPEPADFDGDGLSDFVIFRNGLWYLVYSSTVTTYGTQFGTTGDIPVAADYDGDAKADFAVFRPSSGIWYILNSSNGQLQSIQLGINGDKPVPGDYNGDGRADVAVWRPSNGTWYTSTNPATNFDAVVWGQSGDIAVPGDYDGDGKHDRAIFRPSTATWWIYYSSNGGYLAQPFGVSTDQPVPADYDGDGKTNIAVFRPGTGLWYTSLDVNTNYGSQLWGQSGDIPVESSNVP